MLLKRKKIFYIFTEGMGLLYLATPNPGRSSPSKVLADMYLPGRWVKFTAYIFFSPFSPATEV
jgi:hypothetical protein